jgi:hypothetical protein
MGCFPSSDEAPDYAHATEEELWAHLGILSRETQWRIYYALDSGNLDVQGDQAYFTLYELNKRFAQPWSVLEAELRRRGYFIWLFKMRPLLESDWDDIPSADNPTVRVSVYLGNEVGALAKRDYYAKSGVDQSF